jgi:hypothetical protein
MKAEEVVGKKTRAAAGASECGGRRRRDRPARAGAAGRKTGGALGVAGRKKTGGFACVLEEEG